VAGCVPSSFGSPLREFNKCHDAKGKFCSGPRGLTGLRATPPATMHGRMDPAHAMNYDVARAQQLGISVDVFAGAGSSGSARSLRNAVRVGYPQDRATPLETTDDEYKPSRASDLSVLRHEIGHVTDRGFGMRGDPSEARILGRTYPAWYLMEFGAWKAAVRDAPYNRVQWPRVAKSLRSYLAELMPLPDAWQTAKAHGPDFSGRCLQRRRRVGDHDGRVFPSCGQGRGRTVLGLRSAAGFAGSVRCRASDSHLVRCRRDQAPTPALDVLDFKERCDSLEQRRPPGLRKPNQQQAVMRARCVLPDVGEIQVLCDEEASFCLSGLPHDGVVFAGDAFRWYGIDVMAQLG